MVDIMQITVHLGLHKTATTFMQKEFFPRYSSELGYMSLRDSAAEFLAYVLDCHDLEWSVSKAHEMLLDAVAKAGKSGCGRMLISDEQLCGSPWDNASSRMRYFDRLNNVFPSAEYLIVFRNQPEMVQSLYLQYIKTGGRASPSDFLTKSKHPLQFAQGSYLNYGAYVEYIKSVVGGGRLGCFFYEDMRADKAGFCKSLSLFLGISAKSDSLEETSRRRNKSICAGWVPFIRMANRVCSSVRSPSLIFPRVIHRLLIKFAVIVSWRQSRPAVSRLEVEEFCLNAMKGNGIVAEHVNRDLDDIGY